jgi:hypothetical protein
MHETLNDLVADRLSLGLSTSPLITSIRGFPEFFHEHVHAGIVEH